MALTEIKLDKALVAYLTNPENELLSEFRVKAPGSFKHCEEVASLCEKIGRALNLDVDLLKIIALYHDIGKMLFPLYYSENQPKDSNIHDSLSPDISAHFIISHVANSIAILTTRVPNMSLEIVKCISQHHGNSKLRQFLDKLPEDERVDREKEFAYPYSKPDNVYSCILMIVDIVEARIRSMKTLDPDVDTTKAIEGIIEQLTRETNLDELTIKQGRIITETLLSEYNAVDHKRISYEKKV